ncbi:Response regulator receiver domain-containing protein [Candidatus Frackibacter sp. WG11]|uniref:response regulator transcription factor n=1 Tax=Candidatus Frackibacter sp. WG11 TaxID=2017976 RepID=UPI000886A689|nr:response regulator [Candidatus Frackibacter sp. WG11]SDC29592.1 Response regulator receiver domain-containing protein [Candidatus Frackibacter sp. WG11]
MGRILLVEDTKNIILSVKMCLEGAGYEVAVVEDGVTAVDRALRQKPDLVLLDILIPKMNGYLVCEALREDDKTKDIPIVMLSAKAEEKDIKKAMKLGADDYLVKPFEPSELLDKVVENI